MTMADGASNLAVYRQPAAAIVSFEEMERMADAFARSSLFGAKTKEQALSLLLLGQAEGMHPALAVQEFDIIEGKPSRKSERIQARFQLSGGSIEFLTYTDEKVEAKFSHPQGSTVTVEWTIERAKKVKFMSKGEWKPLTGKANWINYPRAMLKARVISEGCKASFPGYAIVTLSTEEALDGDVMQAHVVDEDFSQDESAAGGLRGLVRGKAKDDLVAELIARMAAATSDGALAAAWQACELYQPGAGGVAYVSHAVFSGLETARDQHEERIARLNGAEAAMEHDIANAVSSTMNGKESPFETLKAEGLGCTTMDALKAWAAKLNPDTLKKCAESEVNELRNIYRNKIDDIKSSDGADF